MTGTERPEHGFTVATEAYRGPFDVLLSLIARRELEVTQLALSDITEEFISYVSAMDLDSHADEASEFLVVASILVEAKSAALLPDSESSPDDEQSLEALRERDLLFARLLQYKAFKQAGENLRARFARNSGRYDHHPQLSDAVQQLLEQVQWTLSPYDFALLAAQVFHNAPPQEVALKQLHVPLADLQEESEKVRKTLSAHRGHSVTFEELVADTTDKGQVVARFLSVLAYFKQGFVQFKQEAPFEPLRLRWVATDEEFERYGDVVKTQDFA